MSRLFNGTSDFMQSASDLDFSGNNQLTVSYWLYWSGGDSNFHLFCELSTDMNAVQTGFYISQDAPSARFDSTLKGNVGNSSYLVDYSGFPVNVGAWHHWCVTLDKAASTDEINMWFDGVQRSASSRPTNSDNTNNFGNLPWYVMSRAGASLFLAGQIAEVTIFQGLLVTADIEQLAAGFSSRLVRPDLARKYWPVYGAYTPENSPVDGNVSLSVTGSSQSVTHPPIIYAQ